MIAIDKPYISDFLIKSIKDNHFQIISTPEARQLIADNSLNWVSETDAINSLKENPNALIYTNSENSIAWMEKNMVSSNRPDQIKVFKNKVLFRELIQDSYPDYFFKAVKFEDLRNLNIEDLKFPFILKPAIGFFSLAVHKVDEPKEWMHVLDKIDYEIEKYWDLYPKEVVNVADFIIEECIEGEEYAIDCYFDHNGKPVILNIMHHIFSSGKDVSDRVYSTSKKIIEEHNDGILEFLNLIGSKVSLINFPAHIEIRINDQGKINPIEVNPLRFGGWCTTADLTWHAYGINSYEHFLNSKVPDWNEILNSRKDKKYSIIILDNNSGYKENEIESFDYELLLKDFTKPLVLRKVDINKFPLFGFVFIETTDGDDEEINTILKSNLHKYIKLKKL